MSDKEKESKKKLEGLRKTTDEEYSKLTITPEDRYTLLEYHNSIYIGICHTKDLIDAYVQVKEKKEELHELLELIDKERTLYEYYSNLFYELQDDLKEKNNE